MPTNSSSYESIRLNMIKSLYDSTYYINVWMLQLVMSLHGNESWMVIFTNSVWSRMDHVQRADKRPSNNGVFYKEANRTYSLMWRQQFNGQRGSLIWRKKYKRHQNSYKSQIICIHPNWMYLNYYYIHLFCARMLTFNLPHSVSIGNRSGLSEGHIVF